MRLVSKTAVITGAGSGIGRAMALIFADEGARVLAADIAPATAEETARLVRAAGGSAESAAVDVSDEEQVRALMALAAERLGRIDILCNNAGIGSTTDVEHCAVEEWDRVMAVNARGVFLGCKLAIPYMLRQGGGAIVNTASAAGLVGLPQRAAYSASKGAIIALTKQIAIEYVQRGIRCNCLCPGTVDSPWVGRLLDQADDPAQARADLTARQPLGRLGTPEEIARAALYLASDDAAFVTGTAFIIDGGLTAR